MYPLRKILYMQTFSLMHQMSAIVQPMNSLWSLETLNNFSSNKEVSDAKIIIGRVLTSARNAYLRCLDKGFNSNSRGLIVDGMFIFSKFYVSKGFRCSHPLLLLNWYQPSQQRSQLFIFFSCAFGGQNVLQKVRKICFFP